MSMLRLFGAAAVILLTAHTVLCQEFRCTLGGSITDPSGSAIHSAEVAVVETHTNATSRALSDASGFFVIPYLVPGDYTVTVQAPGFQRFQQTHLVMAAGDRPVLSIKLAIGAITETVTVEAIAPLISKADASTGQVILTKQVENLPVNGRTPLILTIYTAGVLTLNNLTQTRPFDNASIAGFSIAGFGTKTSEMLIDGSPDTASDGGAAYSPPMDAVSEVRVHTFESDAAYGHTAAGVANQIMRSGTNQLHGSAYEFNEVSAMAANSFFNNAANIKKSVARYNQYGTSAGAPLVVPKLFNGRDRVFWFFAFEGIKNDNPSTSVTTVPTMAERTGDFSSLLRLGSSYQIYDPYGAALSSGKVVRQPFSGNLIPTSRINDVAKKYLTYYPEPNSAGRSAGDGANNFTGPGISTDAFDNEFTRVDFNASTRHRMFASFRHNRRTQITANTLHNEATGSTLDRVNWGGTLEDVFVVSPTTVANVRLNLTRYVQDYASGSRGYAATQLGFPEAMTQQSQYLQMPQIVFGSCPNSSYQCLGWGSLTPALTTWNIYSLFSSVTKSAGGHTVKAGVDLRRFQRSYFAPGASQGIFTFDSTWTKATSSSATIPFGGDMAAFLLGLPTSGTYDLNAFSTAQYDYLSLFVQEDWRVRSNLTLNLGVRFDHDFAPAERFNRIVNGFDQSSASPIAAAAAAAYAAHPISQLAQLAVKGGLTYANANNPYIYDSRSKTFSPRIGVSWSPERLRQTVIRAGFGMFVAPAPFPTINQQGFSQTTQMVVTDDGNLTPKATLSSPFASGFTQPTGSSKGLATFLGQSVSFYNPSYQNGYSLRWQMSVQRQFNANTMLEVGYIGNHAVRLAISNTNMNFIPRQYLTTSLLRDDAVNTALTTLVTNPFAGLLPGTSLNGSNISVAQLLSPYPQFPVTSGVVAQNLGSGGSYFEGMSIRVERRTAAGLTFNGNYMWSKTIEHVSYLNDSDPAPEKRISEFDRTHHAVGTMTWDLPFGNKRHFRLGDSAILEAMFGGWSVNSIYTLQSGAPLSWGNIIYFGGPINLDAHTKNGVALDTTRFDRVSSHQPVYNIRQFSSRFSNLRADRISQLDASIAKVFPIREKLRLQFRLEAFNALNRTQMSGPNLSPTNSSFGLITSTSSSPRQLQAGARLTW
jgi:hypothetical protein